ncbi:MAG: AbrB/MazE/SpoVT family DNA-binding domain-containing protein [Dehalococcoidia bacterium]|nr:AbrB/MazE/SpoVT family DNA-binding domain-containing protein [Dehalococcoidia bacterium]
MAIISRKGGFIIPKEIRERYNLRPGDKVEFVDLAGRISMIPAMKDPIREIRGMFKGGESLTKALLEEHRRELDQEERRLTVKSRRTKAS